MHLVVRARRMFFMRDKNSTRRSGEFLEHRSSGRVIILEEARCLRTPNLVWLRSPYGDIASTQGLGILNRGLCFAPGTTCEQTVGSYKAA